MDDTRTVDVRTVRTDRTDRTTRAVARSLALVLAAVLTAAGCGDAGGKTGGSAAPVVLTLADGYSDPAYEPAVAFFIKRVNELSDGKVTVKDVPGWGDNDPDAEQQIVADVAAGKADLGWVGTRIFDTLGVTSFRALTAPMLVDSYPLEDAVIASDLPATMLQSLDDLDVTGLAVLGDGLRKPVAQDAPLLTPADWQGISFNVFRSDAQTAAVAATGATPTDDLSGAVPFTALERNLLIYRNNYVTNYPYVTANINLWPQTLALFANSDRLAGLTSQQRGWVRRAADEAAAGSTAMFDHDQDLVAAVCAKGGRFADATPEDVTALRAEFDGVYADLEKDEATKESIAEIEAMKADLSPPDPLQIPSNCTATAADLPADDPLQGVWQSEALTEGQIVQAFVAAGGSESEGHAFFAQFGGGATETVTFRLDFEHGAMDQYESADGGTFMHGDGRAYHLEAGTLTFSSPGCEATYSVDLRGDDLRLRPVAECEGDDAPYAETIYGSFPYQRSVQ